MKLFPILAAFLLLSCTPQKQEVLQPPEYGNVAEDGYHFETKEYENLHPDVHVVYHRNLVELERAFMKKTGAKPDDAARILAYTNINKYGCELHIVDPAVRYDPVSAGHEFLHCVNGGWHPTQGK
jgi:hypothetical protein